MRLKPRGGSSRARRYWQRVRRDPKACPGGDCLCDFHEGKTDRLKSRAVQKQTNQRLIGEYEL